MPLVNVISGRPQINPGLMRHQVTILSQAPTSPPTYDSAGQVLSAWKTFTTAMAAIETVRGTDVIRSGQTTTQLFLTVAIWFQPGIFASMRVQNDNGSVYVIQSIENMLEMDFVLVLNCLGLGVNE